jgi:hypothetical protein
MWRKRNKLTIQLIVGPASTVMVLVVMVTALRLKTYRTALSGKSGDAQMNEH